MDGSAPSKTRLLNAKQAARWLGISHKMFKELVDAGKIPFVVPRNRRYYAVDDLRIYIEKEKRVVTCPDHEKASQKSRRGRGTTSTTGQSKVIGFEAALERLKAKLAQTESR